MKISSRLISILLGGIYCVLGSFDTTTLMAQETFFIETDNHCRPVSNTLTIEGVSRTISKQEISLNKQLASIKNKLEEVNFDKTSVTINKKISVLLKKQNSIENKLERLYALGKPISVDVLTFTVIFCEKILKTTTQEYKYWGINQIILPPKNKDIEAGAISISYDTLLTFAPFVDTATITFYIERNAFKQIEAKKITLEWKIILSSYKEKPKELNCSFLPKPTKDFLNQLHQTKDNVGIYYISNLEEFNSKISQELLEYISRN